MRRLLLSLALVLIFTASTFAAPIVSVNFVGGRTTATGGGAGSDSVTGSAGVAAAINWNNFTPPSGGPSPLLNNSGLPSGSITWVSPNTYSATGSSPGGGSNAALMSGYLDNFSNANQSIVVSGLPTSVTQAGYSVYVYFNTDGPGTQGFRVTDSLANSDTAFGRAVAANYPLGGPDGFLVSEDTTNNGTTTQAANVVLLTGFFGPQFTLIGVPGSGADGRAKPTGFQIVANELVPEPVSVSLWLIGGVLLLGVGFFQTRRRQSIGRG